MHLELAMICMRNLIAAETESSAGTWETNSPKESSGLGLMALQEIQMLT